MADFLVTGDTPANFDALFSTTAQVYAPRFEDAVFNSNLTLFQLQRKGRKVMLDGGQSIAINLMYAANNTVTSISDYGTVSLDPQEGLTIAQYAWKQYVASIVISDMDLARNSGRAAFKNLLGAKFEQTELSLIDRLATDVHGTQTSNSLNYFGLQDFCEPNIGTSQTRTVGGIDPSANSWWRNRFSNVQATDFNSTDDDGQTFSTNGLEAMTFIYNSCAEGSDHPDLFITTQSGFENFERRLVFNERLRRISENDVGMTGFETLMFKGAMVGFDDRVSTSNGGHMYAINTRYMQWVVHRDYNFRMHTPARLTPQQFVMIGHLQIIGALTLSNRRRQGVVINVDTFE